MDLQAVLLAFNNTEVTNHEEVVKIIKTLRDGEISNELLDIFQVSIDYGIYRNELKSKFEGQIQTGYIVYPNESYFTDEKKEILKEIVKTTSISIFKAHFGHLLVNLGEKHNDIRSKAIEGYYELIELLKTNLETEVDTIERRKSIDYLYSYISNLGYLLLKKEERFTSLVLELINREDLGYLPIWLIGLAISDSKNFKQTDLLGFDDIIFKYGMAQEKGWSRIYQFELGVNYDRRCSKKTKEWNYLMAQEFEFMVETRNDLAVIEFANKASRLYELAGFKEDSKRMAEKYRENADNRQFEKFSYSQDITEEVNSCLPFIRSIVKKSYTFVLDYLRDSNQILPNKEEMIERAQIILRENSFIQIGAAISIYDINGNIAQTFNSQLEKLNYYMHEATYEYLRINYHIWLGHLFDHLNEEIHWNADNVIDYCENHLWYGNESIKHLGSGGTISFRFIDLISPGIRSYFDEIEKYKAKRNYICNFQLAMESLSLRIEGIVRYIAERNEIQTHYSREDDNGTYISKEKDINMLLSNSESDLIALLGEDLHLYLTNLLIHKNGSNLRNDIAHAFLIPQNYSNFKLMNEVLIAIIRLGDKRFIKSNS